MKHFLLYLRNHSKIIISWILVIAWAIVIFYLSGKCADDSQAQSRGVISSVTGIFGTIITDEEVMTNIDGIVRETAHGVEYFILGLLTFNAVFLSVMAKNQADNEEINHIEAKSNENEKKCLLISVLICTLYSISDEIHQIPIPGRAFEFKDLFIDFVGITLGTLAMYMFYIIRKRNTP